MASLIINTDVIMENISKLNDFLAGYDIKWSIIMKVLGGNEELLKRILNSKELENIHSIGDSHLSSLKTIKAIKPDARTIYIKPPAMDQIKNVVTYADVSLNTSIRTIKALNKEAERQQKIHQIIVMVELGELREGVVRDKLLDFYKQVFELQNVKVVGIGTNLGCMYGIEPTFDKLIQLCLYKKIIELTFDYNFELISGGSSITLPLVGRGKRPKEVNHFRLGEAVFFGTSPFDKKRFKNLSTEAFEFKANIIEMAQKETVPDGVVGEGNIGMVSTKSTKSGKKGYRAIVDFGLLDVDINDLTPEDKHIHFAGTTSDMTVYTVDNYKEDIKYRVGSQITFQPNYMAVARLMNTEFVTKKLTYSE